MVPIVEVAHHDPMPGDVEHFEQTFIDQSRLGPTLARGCSEVHVENMQKVVPDADVGAQCPARLSPYDAQIDLTRSLNVPPAQRDIAQDTLAMLPGLADAA